MRKMKRLKRRTLRFFIALYVGKGLQFLIRILFRKRGTHLPGKVVIRLCPDFLSRVGRPKIILAITGTNGKTSVSNFINQILKANNYTTVCNLEGSNLPAGIASTLIKAATFSGNVKVDVAVFEVDERASRFVYDHLPPTYLLCTNLFRDSIMRNGHSEFILTKIKSSVPKETILILNADDLISCQIGDKHQKKVYFGVDKQEGEREFKNIVCDLIVCPQCQMRLIFKFRHYHHIGQAFCSKCNFKSPIPNFKGLNVDLKQRMFVIKAGNAIYKYPLIGDSIFNLYNIVAVVALLSTFGLTQQQIKRGFEAANIIKDRFLTERYQGLEVITMLAKDQNPISCSRVFDYVANEPGNKVVVLLITDVLDGKNGSEDISWLYDTDFEYLKQGDIKQILIGGTRSYDLFLRLLLAGIDRDIIKLSPNYQQLEALLMVNKVDRVYILYHLYAYPLAYSLKQKIRKRVGG